MSNTHKENSLPNSPNLFTLYFLEDDEIGQIRARARNTLADT
jgi:hypothetical protein